VRTFMRLLNPRVLLLLVFGILVLFLAPACKPETPPTTATTPARPHAVNVAAAADLKFALDDIVAAFGAVHPDVNVKVTYGSSSVFYNQLTSKAPFDLFLSADRDYPRNLIAQDLAPQDSEFQYGVGRIVVWVPTVSKLDLDKLGVQVLLDPSVRKIAVANPAHAPYGRAAEAAMKKLGVYEQAQSRLVLGENIAQTAQFVQTGSADIGIVALSLAVAPTMKDTGRYWEVPVDAYPRMEQSGVILSWAQDPQAAGHLRDYLVSPAGKAVLARYGFLVAKE
jgi:molybdate transport system substrate-binding protein